VALERITRLVRGSGSRLALGLTLHVRVSSEVVVDLAVGRARTQSAQRLGPSTPVPWFSASKLLTTIGIARAWEDGAFGLGDRVTQYLPAFAAGGKDHITIRDLWSHTAPLVRADRSVNTSLTWAEAIDVTGPFAETATLADLLLNGGTHRGQRILRPETAGAVTARHRVGLIDERHGVRLDWGLGLAIDSYLFGRHCSPDTFGQHGANSSVTFADPRHQLAVAMFFNGNCGLTDHIQRTHALATAIYLGLGLVPPHAAGRDHTAPLVGVI